MAPSQKHAASAMEIDRLATQLAKDPHSKAFLPLAEEYCKAGMWEEAVAVLEDGLKHYPGFITAMVVLGRAYDQLKQPTKARAVLEGAVKLSPDNLRAHRTLTKIYASQGLTEDALKSCRVILAMNPRDEEALSVQASLGMTLPEGSRKPTAVQAERRVQPGPIVEKKMVPGKKESGIAVSAVPVTAEHTKENTSSTYNGLQDSTDPDSATASGARADESRHARTLSQLESWLHAIEHRRRDRETSGDRGS